MSSRIYHIDIAKGLGILAIVGLHTSFHVGAWVGWEMPLFFFLSGVFANPYKQGFILSRVNRLLVPACFFYVPVFLYNIVYYVVCQGQISLYDCFKNCAIPTALWFLVSLFYISIMHALIAKYVNGRIGLLLIAIISFTIGYMMSYYNVPQYFFINTSITSFAFYLLGSIFSVRIKSLISINKWVALVCGIVFLIISQLIYDFNNCYIFYRNNELNADIYIVAIVALTGIMGVLLVAVFLSHIKFVTIILTYFGKNSLAILCTHLYYWKFIQPFHLSGAMQFVLVIVCMIPTICLLKTYLPRLSGYQPLFNKIIK